MLISAGSRRTNQTTWSATGLGAFMAARAAVVHPSITQLAHKLLTIRLCAGFTEVRKELAIGANTDKCLAAGTALP